MTTTKTNELKNAVKRLHQDLVRGGKYQEGRLVFIFLRRGALTCNVSKVAFSVSRMLQKVGIRSSTSSSGAYQTFELY